MSDTQIIQYLAKKLTSYPYELDIYTLKSNVGLYPDDIFNLLSYYKKDINDISFDLADIKYVIQHSEISSKMLKYLYGDSIPRLVDLSVEEIKEVMGDSINTSKVELLHYLTQDLIFPERFGWISIEQMYESVEFIRYSNIKKVLSNVS